MLWLWQHLQILINSAYLHIRIHRWSHSDAATLLLPQLTHMILFRLFLILAIVLFRALSTSIYSFIPFFSIVFLVCCWICLGEESVIFESKRYDKYSACIVCMTLLWCFVAYFECYYCFRSVFFFYPLGYRKQKEGTREQQEYAVSE